MTLTQRLLIIFITVVIGIQIILHAFNFMPVLGLVSAAIISGLVYLILKPLFKDEKSI